MIRDESQNRKDFHPGTKSLSLFSGSDLGWIDRFRVAAHLRGCAGCRAEVERFRTSKANLRAESVDLPEGLQWDRLAAEMTANINLGVEAGECVAPFAMRTAASEAPRRMDWRAAAVMGAVGAVLIGAWFLNPPRPHNLDQVIRTSQKIEIRNTAAGLEMNENGNSLVLLHGSGIQPQRAMIVSAPGQLRARYADGDTGQITINHVYSE